jgi:L-2-hydroxyglutarate oxidase LhgO
MERVDALVVGAGVVGLAVARALAAAGHETWVAEAGPAIGQGVSARNSEVIHGGIYYTPGSLKARLCVRGKELLYALCASHGVDHRRCGKLIVANSPEEIIALRSLQARAAANGVPVEWLSGEEARTLEPALRCDAAVWSPSTGIVDSHGLMLALQADLERAGGLVALGSPVAGARLCAWGPGSDHVVRLADGSELQTAWVVNAASLGACQLARHFDGLDPRHIPKPHLAKGNYFALAGRAPFSRLIYPAPADAWLGVHLTLDLGGQARFGPDLQWLEGEDPSTIDYAVDPSRARAFESEIRRYWPGLPDGALQPAYSGVRPKIHGPGDTAPDFRLDGPAQHGVPGLVNLFGIESPGLTSALAIGEWVASVAGPAGRTPPR